MVVHLTGRVCEMDKIIKISNKYKIPIIEDCSQSAGAKYKYLKLGSIGTFGCFSFFPTKNLSSFGDGGLISTNNIKFAKKIISLREYGWDNKRDSKYFGKNSRLDEIHASILNSISSTFRRIRLSTPN